MALNKPIHLVCTVLFLLAASTPILGSAKEKIERNFLDLETSLHNFMQNTVLKAPDIDSMNSALDIFITENPMVRRILRTNAAGFIVNDLNALSNEPPSSRNLSNQKWLQSITESKQPYYSSNSDSAGNVILFWAWPLLTGPEKNRFSGAAAAFIDLTTLLALVEDSSSFQVSFMGKAFFQNQWEDSDFSESPLLIRGSQDIFIRTPLTPPTRLDSVKTSSAVSVQPQETPQISETDSNFLDSSATMETFASKHQTESSALAKTMLQISIIVSLLLVSSVLVISLSRRRPPNRPTGKFYIEESVPNSLLSKVSADGTLISSLSKKAAHCKLPDTEVISMPVSKTESGSTSRVNSAESPGEEKFDKLSKTVLQIQDEIIELMADEISRLEKQMEFLAKRIEELEKRPA